MITSAPGKVVLWGEYAVLAGAPAAVMAVQQRARVHLEPGDILRLSATGFLTPGINLADATFSGVPVAAMTEHILRSWGYTEYPLAAAIHLDTSAFYQNGVKYGLGSSAALCVALYRALAEQLQRSTSLSEAMQLHHSWQGQRGSGLDVASAWHGGVIRFQDGLATPYQLPGELHWQLIWTGQQASTPAHLGSFSSWRSSNDVGPLQRLCDAADAVFSGPSLWSALEHYIGALSELDQAAALKIFTPRHTRLATIAHRAQVLYKPCGAGGGDVGIAIATSQETLSAFIATLSSEYTALPTEIAPHGVQLTE